jgi:hypothetical protein
MRPERITENIDTFDLVLTSEEGEQSSRSILASAAHQTREQSESSELSYHLQD